MKVTFGCMGYLNFSIMCLQMEARLNFDQALIYVSLANSPLSERLLHPLIDTLQAFFDLVQVMLSRFTSLIRSLRRSAGDGCFQALCYVSTRSFLILQSFLLFDKFR